MTDHELGLRQRVLTFLVLENALVLSPVVRSLATCAPTLGAAFWPEGGVPPRLRWDDLRRRSVERLGALGDELLRQDVHIARERGPWPGGASVRRGTALRIAEQRRLADGIAALPQSQLDDLVGHLRADAPTTSLEELISSAATVLDRLVAAVYASADPSRRWTGALVLCTCVGDATGSLAMMANEARQAELAEALRRLSRENARLAKACRSPEDAALDVSPEALERLSSLLGARAHRGARTAGDPG